MLALLIPGYKSKPSEIFSLILRSCKGLCFYTTIAETFEVGPSLVVDVEREGLVVAFTVNFKTLKLSFEVNRNAVVRDLGTCVKRARNKFKW